MVAPRTRDEVIRTIRNHRDELDRRGIRRVLLFGSLARDERTASSDVDLLVDFDHTAGLFEIGGTQVFFEQLLGCDVDLGTLGMLRAEIRDEVLREAVDAIG
jgi:predicted nucleotidyltransferase